MATFVVSTVSLDRLFGGVDSSSADTLTLKSFSSLETFPLFSKSVIATLEPVDEDSIDSINDYIFDLYDGILDIGLGPKRHIPHVCLHELFEQIVKAYPENVAIRHNDVSMTYAETNAMANTLAVQLQSMGVSRETRVGLLVSRGVHMVVAMLAILKAGGAYVPIDPNYPEQRISHVLTDSDTQIVLAHKSLRHLLPTWFSGHVLELDSLQTVEGCVPEIVSRPEDLALIMYTSGTTGLPKGVAIEHRNAVAFTENSYWDGVKPGDVFAQVNTPCFIATMNDIWLPLARGATIAVVEKEQLLEPESFKRCIKANGVTCVLMTPRLLEALVVADVTMFDGLNYVQFAGDACNVEIVSRLVGRVQHLQHLYGCTERTSCTLAHEMGPSDVGQAPGYRLPIGRPVDNALVYVLDGNMIPIQHGEVGELFIGGEQVTRGYLNRAELTAEKFIPNPYGSGRLYRTGDLVRWREDGCMELLGRMDSQIKIRGHRIELQEIEVVMSGCGGVSACVVDVRKDPVRGDSYLIGYVTPSDVDTEAVLAVARAALPDYMVPACVIPIDTIPLSINGKVNRSALPDPAEYFKQNVTDVEPPQNDTEIAVVDVFAEVLSADLGSIGRNLSFFDLGGHSLAVMRVLAALSKKFGGVLSRPLGVSDVYNHPTAQAMAELLTSLTSKNSSPVGAPWAEEIVLLHPGTDHTAQPIFFVHAGDGGVIPLRHIAAGLAGHTSSMYGIQLTSRALETLAANGIEGLAALYLESVRTVQPTGPLNLAGFSFGVKVACEMALTEERAGRDVSWVVFVEGTWCPADILADFVNSPTIQSSWPIVIAQTLAANQIPANDMDVLSARLSEILESGDVTMDKVMDATFAAVSPFLPANEIAQIRSVFGVVTSAAKNYIVCGRLQAPISLVRAVDDSVTRTSIVGHLADWEEHMHDFAWNMIGQVSCVVTAPGNHFSVVEGTGAKMIADVLKC